MINDETYDHILFIRLYVLDLLNLIFNNITLKFHGKDKGYGEHKNNTNVAKFITLPLKYTCKITSATGTSTISN